MPPKLSSCTKVDLLTLRVNFVEYVAEYNLLLLEAEKIKHKSIELENAWNRALGAVREEFEKSNPGFTISDKLEVIKHDTSDNTSE